MVTAPLARMEFVGFARLVQQTSDPEARLPAPTRIRGRRSEKVSPEVTRRSASVAGYVRDAGSGHDMSGYRSSGNPVLPMLSGDLFVRAALRGNA
jgi:hypothetical protein